MDVPVVLEHIGEDTTAHARCLHESGNVLIALGNIDQAQDVLLTALHILHKQVGSHDPGVTEILTKLHDLY